MKAFWGQRIKGNICRVKSVLMSFHPIRDIILAFLAGCLGFAAKVQAPLRVGPGAAGAGAPANITAPNTQAQPAAAVGASKYEE